MTPLETLSFILDLIANLVGVFGIPFAVWRLYTNWQEEKRRQQPISVELFCDETDTVIQLPVNVKRANFSRAELLGYLGMVSKTGNRYDLSHLSNQAFFEELQRIQNSPNPETLRIPCSPREIAQFKEKNDFLTGVDVTIPVIPPTAVPPILLNFTHPLTADQLAHISDLIGQPISDYRHIPLQLDNSRPFPGQLDAILDSLNLTPDQWQTSPFLVNPPAYAPAAVTLLADLHGRMGYFPATIRTRPVPNTTPPHYEIGEIINLQAARDQARSTRRKQVDNAG